MATKHASLWSVMNVSIAPAESSFLLWSLGVLVTLLGAHVGLAALRLARRTQPLRRQQGLLLVTALAWGTALCFGFLLGVASLALPYTLGFQALAGLGLWLGSCAGAGGLALLLLRRVGRRPHALAGAALGLLALALQAGWLAAAGLRPGLVWRPEVLAAAGLLMTVGLAVAIHTGLGEKASTSRLRARWRLAATVFASLALLAGQEVLLAGMGLPAQVGSVFRHQLSMSLISLLGGAVVPVVLAVAALDLAYGRRDSHRPQRSTHLMAPEASARPARRRKARIPGL